MSTIVASGQVISSAKKRTPKFAAKLFASAAILAIAITFVLKYVFRYYLHYSQAAFTDPLRGAANYWAMRGWLLMHMTGGMVALLTGPWQFWTGFRARYARLHCWTGRLFLCAVAVGSIGAFRMASATTFGWAFGVALGALATAWVTTAAMAYYAILNGRVQIHKEWMARAYVVTFAFVTFRVLNDYGPTSHLQPANDRAVHDRMGFVGSSAARHRGHPTTPAYALVCYFRLSVISSRTALGNDPPDLSGRAMARSGLRIMPTFPLPSLKVGSRTDAKPLRSDLFVAPRFLWECLTNRIVSWFSAPAASNRACPFRALGFPACFLSRFM